MKVAGIILISIICIGGLFSAEVKYDTITTAAPQIGNANYRDLMGRVGTYLQGIQPEYAPSMRVTLKSVIYKMPHTTDKFQRMFVANWEENMKEKARKSIYSILLESIDQIFNTDFLVRASRHPQTMNELKFIRSGQQAIPFLAHISGPLSSRLMDRIKKEVDLIKLPLEIKEKYKLAEIVVLVEDFLINHIHSVMAEMFTLLSTRATYVAPPKYTK